MNAISPDAVTIPHVLLVEDSPGDILIMREAFQSAGRKVTLHVVADGFEAMRFLRREPPFAGAPRPDMILLDLNMPRMDGLEALAQIKQDDSLQAIPTIMLTAFGQDADIQRSYELNVNCYLVKPLELTALESTVKSLTDFWLSKAQLPPRDARG